jgi:hypothetical protein
MNNEIFNGALVLMGILFLQAGSCKKRVNIYIAKDPFKGKADVNTLLTRTANQRLSICSRQRWSGALAFAHSLKARLVKSNPGFLYCVSSSLLEFT